MTVSMKSEEIWEGCQCTLERRGLKVRTESWPKQDQNTCLWTRVIQVEAWGHADSNKENGGFSVNRPEQRWYSVERQEDANLSGQVGIGGGKCCVHEMIEKTTKHRTANQCGLETGAPRKRHETELEMAGDKGFSLGVMLMDRIKTESIRETAHQMFKRYTRLRWFGHVLSSNNDYGRMLRRQVLGRRSREEIYRCTNRQH